MESQNKPYRWEMFFHQKSDATDAFLHKYFQLKEYFLRGGFDYLHSLPAISRSGTDHLFPTTESVSREHENAQKLHHPDFQTRMRPTAPPHTSPG